MDNKAIIERFYSAFQQLDYKTMNNCYSEDIIFSDPVFQILKGDEVRSARDFVDKVGSASGTSGKPYMIRFKDGREISSRDFLLSELKKREAPERHS